MPLRLVLSKTGEPTPHVVFPVNAITSSLVELQDGSAIEVGLTGAEGAVGLDLLYRVREAAVTVIVQIPGWGWQMKAEDFEREVIAKNTEFYSVLLNYSRAFYAMVAQSGACNARHPLEQRLARWLCMVHDRVKDDEFPLTQEFIALMLGVRRAGVTQAAVSLRNEGAIEYERGGIRVLDREKLEGSSCECYAVIRRLGDAVVARGQERDNT